MSAIEDALRAHVAAAVEPLRVDVERLAREIAALRRALPPQLYPLRLAAERLGVSYSTARRRVDRGEWPCRREGGRILVDLAALHASDEEVPHGDG